MSVPTPMAVHYFAIDVIPLTLRTVVGQQGYNFLAQRYIVTDLGHVTSSVT